MVRSQRYRRLALALVAALGLVGAAPVTSVAAPPVGTQAGDDSIDIGEAAASVVWLCRPGLVDDPCRADRTATIQRAGGTSEEQRPRPSTRRPVDCFYVYPTVSAQPSTNADLTIDPELVAIAETQASRFSEVCRVFAPVYPQITIAGLGRGGGGEGAGAIAYGGVQAAWEDYLEHDNHGRGVVLIGHSQGAGMLAALYRLAIENNDARGLIVSALLLGTNVTVPKGTDVGGTFLRLPACRKASQTGCLVTYVSFDELPPAGSLFARLGGFTSAPEGVDPATLEVLCVNPAALAGGTGQLDPYFRTTDFPGPIGATSPSPYDAPTEWVSQPGLYEARCESGDGATWLQIDDVGSATDQRPRVRPTLGPSWGLHLVDVNLALGNLVDLVRTQAASYRRSRG